MTKKDKLIGIRYVGAGAYIVGIPARDLSVEEWNGLPPEAQKAALEAKIYQPVMGEEND